MDDQDRRQIRLMNLKLDLIAGFLGVFLIYMGADWAAPRIAHSFGIGSDMAWWGAFGVLTAAVIYWTAQARD